MEKTGRDEERRTGAGMGEALLEKSLETAFSDPAMAVRLANLGVRLSLYLGEAPWGPVEKRNRRPARRNPGA